MPRRAPRPVLRRARRRRAHVRRDRRAAPGRAAAIRMRRGRPPPARSPPPDATAALLSRWRGSRGPMGAAAAPATERRTRPETPRPPPSRPTLGTVGPMTLSPSITTPRAPARRPTGRRRGCCASASRALGACVVAYSGGVDSSVRAARRARAAGRARARRDRALRFVRRARTRAGAGAGRADRRRGRGGGPPRELADPRFRDNPPTAATTARASCIAELDAWSPRALRRRAIARRHQSPTTSATSARARRAAEERDVRLAAGRDSASRRPTCAPLAARARAASAGQAGLAVPGVALPLRHRASPPSKLARWRRAEAWLRALRLRRVPRAAPRRRRPARAARWPICPAGAGAGCAADALWRRCASWAIAYVTLDLEGFRSGSLNEMLPGARGAGGRGAAPAREGEA